jgi:hypothetical protein
MPHDRPPEPWHSFFLDIDRALDFPVAIHCIGGFAMSMLHGLPRPTIDVDCIAVTPADATEQLQSLAGPASALHGKHGVYVQYVPIVTVPEDYAERLIIMFPGTYCKLVLMGLEAHDLALSKLERNSARDREDVKYLARSAPLDLSVLERRYEVELGPYLTNPERHDLTLRMWLEMLRR